MKIYTIVWITKFDKLYSMEPIGSYKDMGTALEYVAKLESAWRKMGSGKKYEESSFDIIDIEVDEEPYLLEHLKKMDETAHDLMDKELRKLMRQGLVEQLVGEDGHFYYELTDKGKDFTKNRRDGPSKDWKKFFNTE
jgi:predicted transcriptional regulator